MPCRSSSRRRNSAATRGSSSIRPRRSRSRTRFRTGPDDALPRVPGQHLRPVLERDRPGWPGHARAPVVGHDRGGGVELAPPGVERVVTHGHLEGGLGVAACAAVPSGHQFFDVAGRTARGQELLRRAGADGRSVIVSPTTRLGGPSARSATSARSSAMARCFSASISPAARSRIRSSSSRVAAMSASRVSCATFWARARISFDSRRASARVGDPLGFRDSRGRGAPARRPSGPARSRPCGRRASCDTGLNANVQMMDEEQRGS